MNHKRGRAKAQRAGCLLCKPHKLTGRDAPAVRRVLQPDGDPCSVCLGTSTNCCACSFCEYCHEAIDPPPSASYNEPMPVTLGELARAA